MYIIGGENMADIKLRTVVGNQDDSGNTKKRSVALKGINESVGNEDLYQGAGLLAGMLEGELDMAVKVTEEVLGE